MFTTLYNLIPVLLNAIFDTFYICAWFCFLGLQYYKTFVYPLRQELKSLRNQQDILFHAIKKLKNIIDIDKQASTEQVNMRIKYIKRDLDCMYNAFGKRIDRIEEKFFSNPYSNESEEDESEEVEEVEEEKSDSSSSVSDEKCILPIQNHITFPHNQKKQDKDTLLLSYQLCEFLGYEPGTTMPHKEAYDDVLRLTKGNKKITRMYKIRIVPKIQKLFGISENEDYEITLANLHMFLKPHLR